MSKAMYVQKYRSEWETIPALKPWLQPDSNDQRKAYCKYCKITISARLNDLNRHCASGKPVTAAKPYGPTQSKLTFLSKQIILAKNEAQAKLAMFVAVHTSINSVDHLSNICNVIFRDSSSSGFKMHRTKCSGIITNLIGNHFSECLIQDIKNSESYSILLDESTDITVTKMLGLVVRYYSKERNSVICTFLSLLEVESGKAVDIVKALVNYLRTVKIDIKCLCGIGSDNASVMTGDLNGVYQILKRDYSLPNLVLVHCVCHSIQLALSEATKTTLPRNLEFLIKETYGWFSQSTERQKKYNELYKTINNGDTPLKIPAMCATRWISVEPAVGRILSQWLELKTHFGICRLSENCYTAEVLHNMYQDNQNLLYFNFLYPILQQVQKTNKFFESDVSDATKLFESLDNLIKSLCLRILIPTAHSSFDFLSDRLEDRLDPIPYLGYSFEKCATDLKMSQDQESLNAIKQRCVNFVIKLVSELRRRLPSNLELLRSCSLLSVSESLKHPSQKIPITQLAAQFFSNPNDIQNIENEWQNLNFHRWSATTDTDAFWAEVNLARDAGGNDMFQNICKLAKLILCLPHSNAAIERVFSHMNHFKNKIRNKLGVRAVNALLNIKFSLLKCGSCCDTFKLPDKVLENIGTEAVYNAVIQRDDNIEEILNDNERMEVVFQ